MMNPQAVESAVNVFTRFVPLWVRRSWVRFRLKRVARNLEVFRLEPPESFVENKRLDKAIRDAVFCPTAGMHVLCAPTGSGKTTATRHTLRTLQQQHHIVGTIPMDGTVYEYGRNSHAVDWLAKQHHFTPPTHDLHEILPVSKKGKRVVLLLDQCDNLALNSGYNNPLFQTMLTHMAEESARKKTFTVLVIVKTPDLATRMLDWNGKQKISPVLPLNVEFSWTPEELVAVLARHVALGTYKGLKKEDEELIRKKIEDREIKQIGELLAALTGFFVHP